MSVKAHILGVLDQANHDYGHYRIAFKLLAGAALRTPDHAAAAGQLLPLQLLEERGARCTEEAAELAAVNGHLHILQFLEERGTLTPRAALVILHHATDGDNWKKRDCWCSAEPLHKWKCVTVRKGGMYLDLKGNCLAGALPRSIGALGHSLHTLSLSHNGIAGAIPESIGRLRSLRHLSLASNSLDGPIPASIGDLTQLRDLHLDNNRLTGCVPDSFGQLTELEKLYLHHLQLSAGPLVSTLQRLGKLRALMLDVSAVLANELEEVSMLPGVDLVPDRRGANDDERGVDGQSAG